MTFRRNPGAVRQLLSNARARQVIDRAGEAVEKEAERLAPRDTGRGAEPGIARTVDEDESGAVCYVGHAKRARGFYLRFQEFGTENHPPQPHLRPAAQSARYRE